jgi:hypothetical protein
MSPITSRGASGCATAYAAATNTIVRIVRSVPYSRLGAFGELSVTGFQVTQFGPSSGSCVPSERLPAHGSPVETA